MKAQTIIVDKDLNEHNGYFGSFGGNFVPPSLETPLKHLELSFKEALQDTTFLNELSYYQRQYIGRATPLYFAKNLTQKIGGAKIYFKREDLNHTGSHKINNAIAQALLAKRMGKKDVVAETGAGQHGVASATVAALMNMSCTVFMGKTDCERQSHNVFRMKMLGAKVIPVDKGSGTLKEAVDEALKYYANNADKAFYLLGSAVGPHPYPLMVRTFQSIIGAEVKQQILDAENKYPDAIVASVGGGSNAIGLFYAFLNEPSVAITGVEPAGKGLNTKEHAATITKGKPAILHGFKSIALVDDNHMPLPVHSIAAGLDYPSVGPEHSFLYSQGRAEYTTITDKEAQSAFLETSRTEGIIPALESAHAIAQGIKMAKNMEKDNIIIVNLSGRGDKDVSQLMEDKAFLADL